ncbi:MAG TPA: hypothetical protein VJ932_04590, partial [Alkalispirochaeta sp.]|nr:hypothetical protein [Alkalispirochaeta sp.]
MNIVARLLVVGAVAIAGGGCASTGPEPLQTPPTRTPGLGSTAEAIPWSGEDLLFLQRAVVDLEARLQSPSVTATSDVEITVGPSTTLTELMVAASFSEWEAGQTLLVESGMVDARAAARLERALIRVRGASMAGSLDVASRRLPAALGLHWSGWERLGRGLWREPVSQVSVHIPHRGDWRVQRGPAITVPVEETLTGGATRLLVAAGAPQG